MTVAKATKQQTPASTAKAKAPAKPPRQRLGGIGKYREIIFSIALFLIFDLGVLTLNFFIAKQIRTDAVAVNLAGRQRMLTQRVSKSLLNLDTALREGTSVDHAFGGIEPRLPALRPDPDCFF